MGDHFRSGVHHLQSEGVAIDHERGLAVGLDGNVANNASVPHANCSAVAVGEGEERGEGNDGRVRLDCLEIAFHGGAGQDATLENRGEFMW